MQLSRTHHAGGITALFSRIGAQFDPQVLQLPGGFLIALLLFFCTAVTSTVGGWRPTAGIEKAA